MSFELSVPEKVIFGKGCLAGLEQLVAGYGDRALVVHGANPDRAQSVKGLLVKSGFETHLYSVGGEPTVEDIAKRSEEHTSELQSHLNLVCRLLLEKKKNKKHDIVARPIRKSPSARNRQDAQTPQEQRHPARPTHPASLASIEESSTTGESSRSSQT